MDLDRPEACAEVGFGSDGLGLCLGASLRSSLPALSRMGRRRIHLDVNAQKQKSQLHPDECFRPPRLFHLMLRSYH